MTPIRFIKRFIVFIVVVIVGLVSLISVHSKYQDLAQSNRSLELRMQDLAAENKSLIERQHRLQTDPVFAESVARNRLRVAQEGEVIYKIIPED